MSPGLQVLRIAVPAILALALGAVFYFVLLAPSRASLQLGTRGLVRTRSLQRVAWWRHSEPLVRWLGVQLEPLMGSKLRERLDRELVIAGDAFGLLPEELVAATGLVSLGTSALGLFMAWVYDSDPVLYGLLGLVVGGLLPWLALTSRQDERRKSVHDGLPCVIDLLSLALSAGIDFPGAIRQVVSKTSNPNDPLIEELNVILHELSVGKTRKDALQGLADRVPIESVRDFVAAVVQAEERGTPLEEVLRIQAHVSRERRSVMAEEAAARAGAKMFGPIILIFLVVMMLILVPLALGLEQALLQG
jgi:tight adherence protein C